MLYATLLCVSPFLNAEDSKPKNIIMIIGDGMGAAYTSAYRYFHDNPKTKKVEQTVFDRHLVGMSSTYPAPISGYVTDSAAAATALATGIKTYNSAIGVDVDKKPLESVLVWAKKQGKKTGIVVTSHINHATPASYLSNNESRHNYDQIADSYFDKKIAGQFKADLMFGGGWKHFIREDRNLVNEFKQAGFYYLDNYKALSKLPKNSPVLGLFADVGLPNAIDDNNKHRLSLMTKAATKHLENEQGYFMLIEASQIDWAGHSNDVGKAMWELDDLAKTLEYLETYVESNPDTLVVITADHNTGGFTIGANKKYQWKPEVLRSMQNSADKVAETLNNTPVTKQLVDELLNFTLTEQEFSQVSHAKSSAQNEQQVFKEQVNQDNENSKNLKRPVSVTKAIHSSITNIIDNRTTSGWTTGGHTGADVQVFAMGANKALFSGLQDNTDIAKKIFKLLGKN